MVDTTVIWDYCQQVGFDEEIVDFIAEKYFVNKEDLLILLSYYRHYPVQRQFGHYLGKKR